MLLCKLKKQLENPSYKNISILVIPIGYYQTYWLFNRLPTQIISLDNEQKDYQDISHHAITKF